MHRRGWIGVVGASVLGHIALFWPVPVIHSSGVHGRVLNVSLVTPVQPAAGLSGGEEAKAGRRELVGQGGRAPDPRQSPPVDAGQALVSTGALKEAQRLDEAGRLAKPHALEVSAAEPSELVSLDSYRFALAKEVLRLQRYPRQLLERGYGGTVELKISFPEAGRLPPTIAVLASSGLQALDDAALAATDEGVKSLPGPGARGVVHLSVLFESDRPAPWIDPGVGGQR